MERLAALDDALPVAGAAVVVEDNRQLPIYARNAAARGPARDKMCRNVGRVDRDVELWQAWLTPRGYDVQLARVARLVFGR